MEHHFYDMLVVNIIKWNRFPLLQSISIEDN